MALLFFSCVKIPFPIMTRKTLIYKRRFNMFSKKMDVIIGIVYAVTLIGTGIMCKSQYDANKSIKRVNDLKLKQMETNK